MARPKIRLDSPGIAAMLRSREVASAVHAQAEAVAAHVDPQLSSGEHMDVQVNDHTTDRAVSYVVLAHPAGLRDQAKHGTLTKAASAAGLEVKAR